MESNIINQFRTENGLPVYLCFPWNIDVALLAIVYFAVAYLWKSKKVRSSGRNGKLEIVFLLITLLLVAMCFYLDNKGLIFFRLDMKNSDYRELFLTVLIPICCFYIFQMIAKTLAHCKIIGPILCRIGQLSLIIMYIHILVREMIVKPLWGDNYSIVIFIVLSILISHIIQEIIKKNKFAMFFCWEERGVNYEYWNSNNMV